MEELTTWLTLARAPGLHAGALRPLLEQHTCATSVVAASAAALREAGIGAPSIEWLRARHEETVAGDRRWLDSDGRHFVAFTDERYPELLKQLPDAPIGLFVAGDPALLCLPQLAIVGSRNP